MGLALRTRPDDERGGLAWDQEIGHAFRNEAKTSKSLQYTYQVIAKLKEEAVGDLIRSEESGGESRKVIMVLDYLLKLPDHMERRGREAERFQIGGRNG